MGSAGERAEICARPEEAICRGKVWGSKLVQDGASNHSGGKTTGSQHKTCGSVNHDRLIRGPPGGSSARGSLVEKVLLVKYP